LAEGISLWAYNAAFTGYPSESILNAASIAAAFVSFLVLTGDNIRQIRF
jgi:hypothetical protein